jgi:hypothetical protein
MWFSSSDAVPPGAALSELFGQIPLEVAAKIKVYNRIVLVHLLFAPEHLCSKMDDSTWIYECS